MPYFLRVPSPNFEPSGSLTRGSPFARGQTDQVHRRAAADRPAVGYVVREKFRRDFMIALTAVAANFIALPVADVFSDCIVNAHEMLDDCAHFLLLVRQRTVLEASTPMPFRMSYMQFAQ